MKRTAKQEAFLTRTTKMKSNSGVTQSSNVQIKIESASLASDFILQSESGIHSNTQKIDTKIEIKEVPVYFEFISLELKSESKMTGSSDVYIKQEPFLSSDFTVQSDSNMLGNYHERDAKFEIKQVPVYLEETSELKSESKETTDSDVHIKREPFSFSSDFTVQSNSNVLGDYHKIDTKIEIKEEPICCKRLSCDQKCKKDEIQLEDAFLYDTEDSDSEGDKEFLLPESTRLDTEATLNYESGVTIEGLDKDCLNPRENNSPYHEQSNITTSHEGHIVETFNEENKMSQKCIFCGKWFIRESDFQIHIVTHKSQRRHNCNICEKSFSQAKYLKRHTLIHESKRLFKCDRCHRNFNWASNLRKHNLIHEDNRPFKCDKCDRSFRLASDLKNHYLIHENKLPFKCDKCDKSFRWPSSMRVHSLVHENTRPLKCDKCDKRFLYASSFRIHTLIHEDKRPFKCDKCDRSFNRVTDLRNHNLIHEGKRRFKCDKCDRSFFRASGLKRHNFMHEGKRPFKCENCDRSFRSASDLKIHKLIHQDERPFKCTKCKWSFTRPSDLKKHNLIHEDKRQFKCDKCDKSFNRASDLKKHNFIHEGKRPFKCAKCDRSFHQASNLKRHNLVHESKSTTGLLCSQATAPQEDSIILA